MNRIEQDKWQEFRSAGLLWFVNQILHIFGWAITVEVDDKKGILDKAYPTRCKFRGFSWEIQVENFEKLARFMKENSKELYDEAEYDKRPEVSQEGKGLVGER